MSFGTGRLGISCLRRRFLGSGNTDKLDVKLPPVSGRTGAPVGGVGGGEVEKLEYVLSVWPGSGCGPSG